MFAGLYVRGQEEKFHGSGETLESGNGMIKEP